MAKTITGLRVQQQLLHNFKNETQLEDFKKELKERTRSQLENYNVTRKLKLLHMRWQFLQPDPLEKKERSSKSKSKSRSPPGANREGNKVDQSFQLPEIPNKPKFKDPDVLNKKPNSRYNNKHYQEAGEGWDRSNTSIVCETRTKLATEPSEKLFSQILGYEDLNNKDKGRITSEIFRTSEKEKRRRNYRKASHPLNSNNGDVETNTSSLLNEIRPYAPDRHSKERESDKRERNDSEHNFRWRPELCSPLLTENDACFESFSSKDMKTQPDNTPFVPILAYMLNKKDTLAENERKLEKSDELENMSFRKDFCLNKRDKIDNNRQSYIKEINGESFSDIKFMIPSNIDESKIPFDLIDNQNEKKSKFDNLTMSRQLRLPATKAMEALIQKTREKCKKQEILGDTDQYGANLLKEAYGDYLQKYVSKGVGIEGSYSRSKTSLNSHGRSEQSIKANQRAQRRSIGRNFEDVVEEIKQSNYDKVKIQEILLERRNQRPDGLSRKFLGTSFIRAQKGKGLENISMIETEKSDKKDPSKGNKPTKKQEESPVINKQKKRVANKSIGIVA